MKYAIIGLGNMGGAVLQGMCRSGKFPAEDICGCEKDAAKQEKYENMGIAVYESESEAAGFADVIVLAVKPQQMSAVLPRIRKACAGKTVISIAAGLPAEMYEKELNEGTRVVRAMPNLNAVYGEAVTGIAGGKRAKEEDLRITEEIFNTVGMTVRVPEEQISVVSAVGGASPAFVFMFIDALAQAGVRAGLRRDMAQQIAAMAVRGSAGTVLSSGEHPAVLRDRVCSPGGTTIEGVKVLESAGFAGTVMEAVEAVIAKDAKLGK